MWKSININKQNIKTETDRSVLIAMPHSSNYDGYCFWHPSKLIHDGRNNNALSLSYSDKFTFKLIKYGKGKHNSHDIISEEIINIEEFENAFQIIDKNISAPQAVNDYATHKPEEIAPVQVETLEELKDD